MLLQVALPQTIDLFSFVVGVGTGITSIAVWSHAMNIFVDALRVEKQIREEE